MHQHHQGKLGVIKAIFICLIALCMCDIASAGLVTYQLSGFASGTLNNTSFNNAAFTLDGVGDSLNVIPVDVGIYLNPLDSVSISIDGLGTSYADDAFYFYVNQTVPIAGFIDVLQGDVNDFSALQLASYDGTTAFDPVAVSSNFLALFSTSNGDLNFTSVNGLIFTATGSSNVPEPGMPALMLLGLFVLGLHYGRRIR